MAPLSSGMGVYSPKQKTPQALPACGVLPFHLSRSNHCTGFSDQSLMIAAPLPVRPAIARPCPPRAQKAPLTLQRGVFYFSIALLLPLFRGVSSSVAMDRCSIIRIKAVCPIPSLAALRRMIFMSSSGILIDT